MKNFMYLLTAVAITWQGCTSSAQQEETTRATEVVPVKIMPLAQSAVRPTLKLSGQLTTDDETLLAFKTGGIVQSVLVKEGDAVRKGQLLAALDLTEIQAQVAQARLSLEKAQRDFTRVSRLYADSVATLEQFQNAQTGLAVAEQQHKAASFNLEHSQIRAAADGFVLRKLVSEGQVVGPGVPVLQTNGAKKGNWLLRAGASDRQWAALTVGDTATAEVDAFPGTPVRATLTRKSEGADAATGLFTVEFSLKPTADKWAAGLFAKLVVTPARAQKAWAIPYDALLDGDAQTGYVFITNDNKQALRTPVEIQEIQKNAILVSRGLESARNLIITGNAYLKDSAAINVINP